MKDLNWRLRGAQEESTTLDRRKTSTHHSPTKPSRNKTIRRSASAPQLHDQEYDTWTSLHDDPEPTVPGSYGTDLARTGVLGTDMDPNWRRPSCDRINLLTEKDICALEDYLKGRVDVKHSCLMKLSRHFFLWAAESEHWTARSQKGLCYAILLRQCIEHWQGWQDYFCALRTDKSVRCDLDQRIRLAIGSLRWNSRLLPPESDAEAGPHINVRSTESHSIADYTDSLLEGPRGTFFPAVNEPSCTTTLTDVAAQVAKRGLSRDTGAPYITGGIATAVSGLAIGTAVRSRYTERKTWNRDQTQRATELHDLVRRASLREVEIAQREAEVDRRETKLRNESVGVTLGADTSALAKKVDEESYLRRRSLFGRRDLSPVSHVKPSQERRRTPSSRYTIVPDCDRHSAPRERECSPRSRHEYYGGVYEALMLEGELASTQRASRQSPEYTKSRRRPVEDQAAKLSRWEADLKNRHEEMTKTETSLQQRRDYMKVQLKKLAAISSKTAVSTDYARLWRTIALVLQIVHKHRQKQQATLERDMGMLFDRERDLQAARRKHEREWKIRRQELTAQETRERRLDEKAAAQNKMYADLDKDIDDFTKTKSETEKVLREREKAWRETKKRDEAAAFLRRKEFLRLSDALDAARRSHEQRVKRDNEMLEEKKAHIQEARNHQGEEGGPGDDGLS
ncbi:uncharacterized protein HMPREF1541_07014 [Cyphellophora europaea CBS 101466]|uniref:Uncharacterized protein n=1 Tax=Cyphellophora europaea (strain CBS 101466) TaxID=1220924 RepID=W2RR98_CYPE1|nr:uncharacterized protein HMPREF1541_07014 [Cyphellophora europaea CBS 101466]ETN38972.1 hypothetical protein HMPREF1541_07014 [Cyphellophora europaea CBS 101466]